MTSEAYSVHECTGHGRLIERGWLAPRSVPCLRYHNCICWVGIELRFAETTADIGEKEVLQKKRRMERDELAVGVVTPPLWTVDRPCTVSMLELRE